MLEHRQYSLHYVCDNDNAIVDQTIARSFADIADSPPRKTPGVCGSLRTVTQ